jgi:hypothetical protein
MTPRDLVGKLYVLRVECEKCDRRGRYSPAPLASWSLPDLRRTVATGLQRLGVRLEVTEAVLNHVSGSRGGIAGVYQRHDWASEKRAALDAWGGHIMAVVERRDPNENILLLSRAV